MKRKLQFLFISISCLFLLTGCWDQRLLKETRFILAIGIDKAKDGKVKGTYEVENAQVYPQSAIITEVEGINGRDTTLAVNNKISEKLDVSKLKVFFIGEKLAKEEGIYPYLDILLREPNNPINTFLIINKGETSSYLTNPIPDEAIPSDYYQKLIQKEVDSGILTNMNVLKSSKLYAATHHDILLPYMKQSPDQTPVVDGLAMFNGDKFTGQTLSPRESVIFNLLDNKKSEQQPSLIIKIRDHEHPNIKNYISLSVLNSKRKIKVNSQNEHVTGKFSLDLDISIIESPKYNVQKYDEFLTKAIEKELTKRTNKVIQKLQKANSDGLGIGQQLHSFHYKEFQKLDWKGEAYKNADIKATVKVTIKEHGLIN